MEDAATDARHFAVVRSRRSDRLLLRLRPELDQVVAGYRTLTGQASMLPNWAFGFWQSKNKYNTQDEVLKTLAEFRRRQIPLDSIVQDWQYWKPDSWGTHEFEASRYPDPDAMIRAIHDSHARFMISVWGSSIRRRRIQGAGRDQRPLSADPHRRHEGLAAATTTSSTTPSTRRPGQLFWDQVNKALFGKGVDAWWMDATEPDIVAAVAADARNRAPRHRQDGDRHGVAGDERVLAGEQPGGLRGPAPRRARSRVFILTRSGFAGIQRYATVTWSGDITSEWTTLRKQITAGLGFSIAGDPYWTTDTGGYTMQNRFTSARDGEALDEWRELNARWFQYSTFTPLLRVHGTDRPREMWNIGDETTPVYQSRAASSTSCATRSSPTSIRWPAR